MIETIRDQFLSVSLSDELTARMDQRLGENPDLEDVLASGAPLVVKHLDRIDSLKIVPDEKKLAVVILYAITSGNDEFLQLFTSDFQNHPSQFHLEFRKQREAGLSNALRNFIQTALPTEFFT